MTLHELASGSMIIGSSIGGEFLYGNYSVQVIIDRD
jgi:hypothetical protein